MDDALSAQVDDPLVELTSSIVAAYVGHNVVPVKELNALIANVHSALKATSRSLVAEAPVEKQKPAVSVRKSVQDDQLTCMECGNSLKSLKRHLMAYHSQTPDEYREKWSLPKGYSMVAPTLANAGHG